MQTFRAAIAALTLAALTGCASGPMERAMSSWTGATVDQVIAQWGYPQEERVIAGRRLLLWHRGGQVAMPMTTTATATPNRYTGTTAITAQTTGGGYATFNCTRILEVRNDVVVGWQWEGNNCPFALIGPYSDWPRK